MRHLYGVHLSSSAGPVGLGDVAPLVVPLAPRPRLARGGHGPVALLLQQGPQAPPPAHQLQGRETYPLQQGCHAWHGGAEVATVELSALVEVSKL